MLVLFIQFDVATKILQQEPVQISNIGEVGTDEFFINDGVLSTLEDLKAGNMVFHQVS